MTHIKIIQALHQLRPMAQWVLRGEILNGLEWIDESQPRPTDEEIITKINEME